MARSAIVGGHIVDRVLVGVRRSPSVAIDMCTIGPRLLLVMMVWPVRVSAVT